MGPFESSLEMILISLYFPGNAPIKVHQNRESHCPKEFPAGYFWYGGKRKGSGKPPRWVEELLNDQEEQSEPPSGQESEE